MFTKPHLNSQEVRRFLDSFTNSGLVLQILDWVCITSPILPTPPRVSMSLNVNTEKALHHFINPTHQRREDGRVSLDFC